MADTLKPCDVTDAMAVAGLDAEDRWTKYPTAYPSRIEVIYLAMNAARTMDDAPAEETTFAEAVKLLERGWYSDDELAQWLNAPHPQFEGLSAVQMLAKGKKADVLATIQRLEDGAYV